MQSSIHLAFFDFLMFSCRAFFLLLYTSLASSSSFGSVLGLACALLYNLLARMHSVLASATFWFHQYTGLFFLFLHLPASTSAAMEQLTIHEQTRCFYNRVFSIQRVRDSSVSATNIRVTVNSVAKSSLNSRVLGYSRRSFHLILCKGCKVKKGPRNMKD